MGAGSRWSWGAGSGSETLGVSNGRFCPCFTHNCFFYIIKLEWFFFLLVKISSRRFKMLIYKNEVVNFLFVCFKNTSYYKSLFHKRVIKGIFFFLFQISIS